MIDVNVRKPDDARFTKWIYYNRALTQVLCVASVSVPVLLVPFLGVTALWISTGFLLPALYFGFVSVIVEKDDEDADISEII